MVVQTVTHQEWVHYSSGGARGVMCMLYASAWEYVMINGSAIPFVGSTGRNPIGYSDTLLDGEALYYPEVHTSYSSYLMMSVAWSHPPGRGSLTSGAVRLDGMCVCVWDAGATV